MMKSNLNVLARLNPSRFVRKTPDGPLVLKQTIDELAPSLRKHATLMKQLQQFIFNNPSASPGKKKKKWSSNQLREEIQRVLPENEKKNMDLLLTILEGMQVAVQYYELPTNETLDGFAQESKMAFKQKLFGASKACPDRVPLHERKEKERYLRKRS